MKTVINTIKSLPSTGNYVLDKTLERLRLLINDQLAIRFRRRQYNLKVTGTNTTVNRAVGMIEELLDESNVVRYWLEFSISITLTTAAAGYSAYIDGIAFMEDTAIVYSDKDSTDDIQRGEALKDTNRIYVESAGTTTSKLLSGKVELKQKPTWY